MYKKLLVFVVVLTLGLGGCASMDESQQNTAKGTAAGTGVGAALGAVIGALAGDPALGAGIGAGVGLAGGYLWSSHMEKQKKELEAVTAGTGIEVTQTQNNMLKMNIPGDFSFDTGSARIKQNMHPVLGSIASGLASNPTSLAMIIGHTDDTGSDAVNSPLSINRAINTRSYLVSQGIPSSRIVIEGHGSHEPIALNDSPANRAKNRRIEVFMYEPQQQQSQQPPPQQQPQQQQQQYQQYQQQYQPQPAF